MKMAFLNSSEGMMCMRKNGLFCICHLPYYHYTEYDKLMCPAIFGDNELIPCSDLFFCLRGSRDSLIKTYNYFVVRNRNRRYFGGSHG